MDGKVLKYVMKTSVEENNSINKRKIIIFFILLLLFITLIILSITQGYMRIEEYEEYAMTVENASIMTVLGPLMFMGSTYAFIGTCIISFISTLVKKIDLKIKRTLQLLPIFVVIFTLPALLSASYIVQLLNLV